MTVGILPLVLGMFSDQFSLSLEQTGVLATVGQVGFGLGSISVLRLRRINAWRKTLFAAAGLAAFFNALTMFADAWALVLTLQLLSGIAGGAVYGLAVYIVGRTPRPEKAFGLMYVVELAAFSGFAAFFPLLRGFGGFPWALNSLGAFLLAAGAIGWALPEHDRPGGSPVNRVSHARAASMHGGMGLLALTVFQLGILAVWAYTERIGTLSGISPQDIGNAIAIAGLAGIAGAGTAAILDLRAGHLLPAVIATGAIVTGNSFLWSPHSYSAFLLGSCLFSYGWLLAIPYYMGAVVASDATGALTSLLVPAQTVGSVGGPLIAALVVAGASANPAIVVSTLGCLAATVPLAMAVRPLTRSAASQPDEE
jgi:predicted MFS family arabinose efflux permease